MLGSIFNLTRVPSNWPIVTRGGLSLRVMLGSVMLCFSCFGLDLSVRAGAEQPAASFQIVACKLGLSGAWKVGFWTPLWIDLRGGAEPFQGEVELIAPDRDGVLTAVRKAVQLRPGAVATVALTTKIGSRDANLTVKLKKGESCEKYYLLIFGPVGNKSVIDAAKQGQVTKIKSVDYATEEYGIYSRNCVYVYGE